MWLVKLSIVASPYFPEIEVCLHFLILMGNSDYIELMEAHNSEGPNVKGKSPLNKWTLVVKTAIKRKRKYSRKLRFTNLEIRTQKLGSKRN